MSDQVRQGRALAAATVLLLGATAGASETFEAEVDAFNELSLGTGVVAEVMCGEEDLVRLETDEHVFDRMKVFVRGDRLVIERGLAFDSFIFQRNDRVRATITTTGALNDVSASTGAVLEMPECAVDKTDLEVSVSTGANLRVAGRTEDLDLKVGTGGVFNSGRFKDRLEVDSAYVRVSTGGVVGLCEAGRVRGKASTGAQIAASRATDVDVRLGTGAHVSHRGCS